MRFYVVQEFEKLCRSGALDYVYVQKSQHHNLAGGVDWLKYSQSGGPLFCCG